MNNKEAIKLFKQILDKSFKECPDFVKGMGEL